VIHHALRGRGERDAVGDRYGELKVHGLLGEAAQCRIKISLARRQNGDISKKAKGVRTERETTKESRAQDRAAQRKV
jgi:hypothetical protein